MHDNFEVNLQSARCQIYKVHDVNRQVAKFGKNHRTIYRKVEQLIQTQPRFSDANFGKCLRINELANGKPEKYYTMTRDGFTMVAMSLTGREDLSI